MLELMYIQPMKCGFVVITGGNDAHQYCRKIYMTQVMSYNGFVHHTPNKDKENHTSLFT